jgi:hypothetical protein
MDLEARAIDVRDLEDKGFLEPEAQARDGGEVDVVVPRGGGREETPHVFNTQDGGETVGSLGAQERKSVPVALEDVLREATDATIADTHGRGGEAVDVFPVQEGVLKCLCSHAVGGCVVALRAQTDFADRRFLRPFALATEVQRRKHVLT